MNPQLELFTSLPDAATVKGLVAWFVRAHNLQQRSRHGINWGLTLPVSMAGERLKVNVGAQQAFYAEYFEDGWWCFVYVPHTEESERILHNIDIRIAVGPGQTNAPVREQLVAAGRPAAIAELLRVRDFFDQSAALVNAFAQRKLPKADRANADVAQFVLDTPAEHLQLSHSLEVGELYRFTEHPAEPSEPAWRLKQLLGRELQRRGLVALVPAENDLDWDLAWQSPTALTLAGISGIAVLTPSDEELELRRALGAMLRKRHRYADASPQLVLVVDRAPVDSSWFDVFGETGMSLVSATQIPTWLDGVAMVMSAAA